MAISDLSLELDQLEDFLFGSRQMNKGQPGSIGSELAKVRHKFTIEIKEIVSQLLKQKEVVGAPKRRYSVAEVRASKGRLKFKSPNDQSEGQYTEEYTALKKAGNFTYITPFEDFEDDLTTFVEELVKAYEAKVKATKDANLLPQPTGRGVGITFVVVSPTQKGAYGVLDKWKRELSQAVIDKGMSGNKDIFVNLFRKSSKSFSSMVHIGHETSLAEERALAGAQQIQQMGARLKEAGAVGPLKDFTKEFEKITNLKLNLKHARQIDLKTGLLIDSRDVETNAEAEWFNQLKSKDGLGDVVSEQKIGQTIKKLIKEFREQLFSFYTPDKTSELNSSQSMLQAAQAMILYSALDSSSGKKKPKVNTKLKRPKSIKPRRPREKSKTFGIKKSSTKNPGLIAGVKAANAKEPSGKGRRGRTESGDSLAPLIALLNSKLPETVARNMGPPGLENQTGRFASSVRVTDVSRTPQGHPSVGYDYRRNPYQVFEMGSGQPPWATPDRDPRKVIDQSIREIAAQFAIGRFYTRRI